MTLEEKYADKIAKLLTQAENPAATPEEAEAFMQKAAALMLEYAIDEAMIDAVRGITRDALEQDEFQYSGIYRNGHRQVAVTVCRHFGLKMVLGRDTYQKPIHLPLYIVGFRSDIERARLLDTSLQIQCASAMRQWSKTVDFSWMDKGLAFRTKRDFVFGFADGVSMKLAMARREATAAAKVNQQERAHEDAAAASASVELVLVSRKKQVDDFYDKTWGGRTRNVSRNYSGGAGGGRNAGFTAGRNANTNTGAGIGGGGKAIGR